jgi:hypothetical protein
MTPEELANSSSNEEAKRKAADEYREKHPLTAFTAAQLVEHVFPVREGFLYRGDVPIFCAGHIDEIFAYRGVGETWFCLTLAIAVAAGTGALVTARRNRAACFTSTAKWEARNFNPA